MGNAAGYCHLNTPRAAGLITLHRPPIMDTFILNKLIAERKWTEFLKALPIGETKVGFQEIADIKSCKAIAYDINSDKTGRRYTFNVNKDEKSAIINVEEQ